MNKGDKGGGTWSEHVVLLGELRFKTYQELVLLSQVIGGKKGPKNL